ncbi:sulfotransferase domain-containing protein [Halospina denitrificans]|uniref:Sulfotransferase domain-containing protein n=1 Tax=Halospina denitrificans TaxID=332522 RepID=A0A4R7JZC3_9GAMM|nr:sulfotransferase domain-containing protein [Halospina denitrificans]TDT43466.1 sulfotransferase domain-containing protein [Halospina denitrificans]
MVKKTAALAFRNFKRKVWGGHQPDFLIVGAQKSGTTSLFSYLQEREGFLGSLPKEVHFFDREDNYKKGFGWYESHFIKPPGKNGLHYEASPTYLFRPKVPERLYEYNPTLKIIILLREPISRAYSAWNMYRQWSEEGFVPWAIQNDPYGRKESRIYQVFFKNGCPSFSDYINIEMDLINEGDAEDEPTLLRRGIYKPQIERYIDAFGSKRVLVLGFNELKTAPETVLKKCYDFLGVPCSELSKTPPGEIKNKRTYPSNISPEDLKTLQEWYAPANDDLFNYLGYRPDW